jgi:gas vesicle protein
MESKIKIHKANVKALKLEIEHLKEQIIKSLQTMNRITKRCHKTRIDIINIFKNSYEESADDAIIEGKLTSLILDKDKGEEYKQLMFDMASSFKEISEEYSQDIENMSDELKEQFKENEESMRECFQECLNEILEKISYETNEIEKIKKV